jgi:hypothetical protein
VSHRLWTTLWALTLVVGCRDVAGPQAIAVQFQGGLTSAGVPAVTITESPLGYVRVVGGYTDGGCGPIGARATLEDWTIRLEIGPRAGNCDLIRLAYSYETTIVGLKAGEYMVRVFHRPSAGTPQFMVEEQVTVH